MSETGKERLYSPQLLALAVVLADYRFDPKAPLIGEAISRTCGSELRLSLTSPDSGLGLQAKACAEFLLGYQRLWASLVSPIG